MEPSKEVVSIKVHTTKKPAEEPKETQEVYILGSDRGYGTF